MTKRKTGSTKTAGTTTNKGSASSTKKAAAKPAAAKASAKAKGAAAATKSTKAKTAKTTKKSANSETCISLEQRTMMIEEAAYYNALNSDHNGQDMQHWLQAEAQIDAMYHT